MRPRAGILFVRYAAALDGDTLRRPLLEFAGRLPPESALARPLPPNRIGMLALERAKDGCAGARDRHIRAAERVDERRIVPALRSLVGRLHGGEIVLDILREYDFGAVLQMQFDIALQMDCARQPPAGRHDDASAAGIRTDPDRPGERDRALRPVRLRAEVRNRH